MSGGDASDAPANTREEETRTRIHVWRRWTDNAEVPFHEYCRLKPTLPRPFKEDWYPEGSEPPLSYTPPVARWALQHTPFLVLLATFLFLFIEFGWVIRRLGTDLVRVLTPVSGVVSLFLVFWVVILLLLVRVVLQFPDKSTVKSVVVHGLVIGLTAGLLVGIYAATPEAPFPLGESVRETLVSFPFAFLWMLLIGGHLVYDGMLKTENMFDQLANKEPAVVEDGEGYEDEFLSNLKADLRHTHEPGKWLPSVLTERWWFPGKIRTAYLFATFFVAPFFFIWWLAPTGTDPISNFALRGGAALVPAILDFFLVVVFFQFLVLINYFNSLLTDPETGESDGTGVTLKYVPSHPDGYAGFRDLGSFSTRVNALLLVGGVYEGYHLYVRGFRTVPELSQGLTIPAVSWGVGNLLPLVTYVFAVVIWLYLSFWQIHKAMRRGRERLLEEHASKRAAADDSQDEEVDRLRNGPVWPINNRLLISIVSMDLMPLLTIVPFLPL